MLREALKQLTDEDKARLLYALEQEITAWVSLPDDMFIGVNIRAIPQLTIVEEEGLWAYGKVA